MEQTNLFKKLIIPSIAILILFFPVAVAGQNIAMFLSAILIGIYSFKNKKQIEFKEVYGILKIPVLLCFALVFWQMISTILGDNPNSNAIKSIAGYLGIVCIPILISFVLYKKTKLTFEYIEKLLFIICLVVGVISLSQYFIGWRIQGSSVISAHYRARGLYSHPLSFAYAVLLLWPFVVVRFFSAPKNIKFILQMLAILVAIVTSESRTVLAIAAFVFFGNIFLSFSGRLRLGIIALSCVLVTGGLSTDNSVSRKLIGTFSEKGFDRNAEKYADDRFVFWHAHYEMIKEKPIIGHGMHINTKYRLPYYEQIGMKDFFKPYAAHNMYIQVLVNTGIIGGILFAFWLIWFLWKSWILRNKSIGFRITLQTFLAFLLGATTQNAFQDSVVRYGVMLLITATFLLYLEAKTSEKSSLR